MALTMLPPSSAAIWGKPGGCTGWALMAQTYPETEENVHAKEGTAAHEIGSEIITDAKTNGVQRHTAADWVGITGSNGVIFTDTMFKSAMVYADDVISIMRKTGIFGVGYLKIEERVKIPRVHELNNGTPDCRLYDPTSNSLYVWDFKHGFEVVEAFENWQAMDYVAGILDELDIDGNLDQKTRVHIRIVQPRAHHRDGPVREWAVMASDLRGYFNHMAANAAESLGPDAKFKTGEHCKYCVGRHSCPAALKAGMGMFEVVSQATPVNLSPEAIGVQLAIVKRARKQLEFLESGFEEQVKGLIRSGALVPGWSVEQGVGRTAWSRPVEEIISLGEMLGIDLCKKPEAITPNQAKELGIDGAVITAYSTRPSTGLKIVPDNLNKAKQVFKK